MCLPTLPTINFNPPSTNSKRLRLNCKVAYILYIEMRPIKLTRRFCRIQKNMLQLCNVKFKLNLLDLQTHDSKFVLRQSLKLYFLTMTAAFEGPHLLGLDWRNPCKKYNSRRQLVCCNLLLNDL